MYRTTRRKPCRSGRGCPVDEFATPTPSITILWETMYVSTNLPPLHRTSQFCGRRCRRARASSHQPGLARNVAVAQARAPGGNMAGGQLLWRVQGWAFSFICRGSGASGGMKEQSMSSAVPTQHNLHSDRLVRPTLFLGAPRSGKCREQKQAQSLQRRARDATEDVGRGMVAILAQAVSPSPELLRIPHHPQRSSHCLPPEWL